MRKKIGKRIGPVPITLAVFALAALLSVGLLLTVDSGNMTHAQGLPSPDEIPPGPDVKDCEVVVVTDSSPPEGVSIPAVADIVEEGTVEGGGCIVSGDSVDVEFLNYEEDEANATKPTYAVYVTGGEEFSNVQARGVKSVGAGDVDLGAKGVDEHILTIEPRTAAVGGGVTPGSETITVSRDMAKNGEVYLFAYKALPGLIFAADADNDVGIPLSVLTGTSQTDAFKNQIIASATVEVNAALDDTNEAVDAAVAGMTTSGLENPYQTTTSTGEYYLVRVPSVGHDEGSVTLEEDAIAAANRVLAIIKGDDNYGITTILAEDNSVTRRGTENLEELVVAAEKEIVKAEAALEAIEDYDSRYFFNESTADIAVKVVFRNTASEAKLVGGVYLPAHDDGTEGSTFFVGRAGGGDVNDEDVPDELTATAEKANVTVRIRDSGGVDLEGFVDLSIDTSAEGAADAVFTASARSTYYVELGTVAPSEMSKDGTVTAEIKGLPKNDALRIPVTASFNNGEVELMSYIVRKGDAMMVMADAYACEADSDDEEDGDCASEIDNLGTSNTSDDPDKVIALGPGDSFVINGKATDAVGNTVGSKGELTWEITEGADNQDDAEASLEESSGNGLEEIIVTGDDDAVPGTYSLTVTSPDGEASETIMITVSDVASMISVSCEPEIIPTDSGLTDCTVMVTDASGNIPSNLHDDDDDNDMVRVIVRSTDVSISGVNDSDDAELDDRGMTTFSIVLREDAPTGNITVFVSAEIGDEMLRSSTSVMYGEAAPEPMPMLLGGPSITSVMSDAAGMATTMLMPGDNADQHWIWALPTDLVSEGMFSDRVAGDATSFTMSGLTSGMSYWFTAVAGRDMEDGTQEWSMYSGWSAETRIE